MKKYIYIVFLLSIFYVFPQDLSVGYIADDLTQHPMQPLAKPAYLDSVMDPSFPGTSIRRISEAASGRSIVPMYNTIQAWNADESLMIVYAVGSGHRLLNGTDYSFIRNLSDIRPDDLEAVFWHFNDPDILFYMDNNTDDFIRYNVRTQSKTILANMRTLSGCNAGLSSGNDVQMMSWDSDVFSFRCGNTSAFYYRISTGVLTQFNISDISYTAPMPFPSGNLFYHQQSVYDANGNFVRALNVKKGEHSCLGKLSNGDDAYFAIAFSQGPDGGCLGTLVAHNATTGNCFAVTPTEDYDYSKSGTHISALAHKNSEGGWVAVSSMGYEKDGVEILDQELFLAKVDEFAGTVYRVAHHRSDEDDIDYWGEPHVTISPTGTRLLFGSDWSGAVDGISVDAYVAELSAYTPSDIEDCPALLVNESEGIVLPTGTSVGGLDSFSGTDTNTNGSPCAYEATNGDGGQPWARYQVALDLAALGIVPGDRLSIGIDGKGANGNARIEVNQNNTPNTALAYGSFGNSWSRFEKIVTVPSGIDTIDLWLFSNYASNNSGMTFYDNLNIVNLGDDGNSCPDLLVNESEGIVLSAGTSVGGLDSFLGTDTNTNGSPCAYEVTNGDGGQPWARYQVALDLEAHGIAPGDRLSIGIDGKGANGNARIEVNQNNTPNTALASRTFGDSWSRFETTVTVPSGINTIDLWLFSNYTSSSSGKALYDNLDIVNLSGSGTANRFDSSTTIAFDGDTGGINDNDVPKISMYPNPTSTSLNVSFSRPILVKEFRLFDIQGRLVRTEKGTNGIPKNDYRLDVYDLPVGSYFLKIFDDQGKVDQKQLLIKR